MDRFNMNDDELAEILNRYGVSADGNDISPATSEPPIYNPDASIYKTKASDEEETDGSESASGERLDEEIEKWDREIEKKQISTKEYIEKKRKKQNKKRISNMITNILLAIFVVCFLGSATYLGVYYIRISKAESKFEDLKGMIDTDSHSVAPEGVGEAPKEETKDDYLKFVDVDGVSVQSKFANLYKKNHDFIGWLTIPDTKIDYPVMFTPDDEEYYLKRDFDKQESASGTLFLGKGSDCLKPSDNVLIYGHNMKAGTMLSDIISYETEEFYNKHKYITFDTIEGNGKYEVIAAFRTAVSEDENSFKYYSFYNASSKEEFDEYVERAKKETPIDIPETAVYGDKLLTLSTCSYHTYEGRFVVVAKKVD